MAFTRKQIENEWAPDSFAGTFQVFPADAFTGSVVTRTFKWPANEVDRPIYQLLQQVLGYAIVSNGVLERNLPWVDFIFNHLVASRVDLIAQNYRGQDPESDAFAGESLTRAPLASANLYKWYKARVHFQEPRFKLGDRLGVEGSDATDWQRGVVPAAGETQRFCYKTVRPGASYVTVKPGSFQWSAASGFTGADLDLKESTAIPYDFNDIIVTWLGVPNNGVPFAAIRNCRNKVNADHEFLPDLPPSGDYDPETLQFYTHQIIPGFFPDGGRCSHLMYHFKEKPFRPEATDGGWNFLPYPGTGTEYRVLRKGDTSKGIFETADFSTLFQMAT